MLCGHFQHHRRVQFEGCVAEQLQTITAILSGSTWSCLLLDFVLQDAFSEVMKVYPPLKRKVFVDDITAFMEGKNKELPGFVKNVLQSIKREVEEKGPKLSIAEGGQEEEKQSDRAMQLSGRKVSGMQQERRR